LAVAAAPGGCNSRLIASVAFFNLLVVPLKITIVFTVFWWGDSQLADGTPLSFDPRQMVLTARIKQGEIIFTPTVDDNGRFVWRCSSGEGLKPKQLPGSCRAAAADQ
jgi:hypothetical protein